MRGERERSPRKFSGGTFWLICAAVLFAAAWVCIAQDSHPASPQDNKSAAASQSSAAASSDSSTQDPDPAKMTRQQKAAAANNERKKQITDESTQLLTMALALKAEVDKTTKDTLSIKVIRKADEIEKLAHNVKEKMKQSAGAS